MHIERAALDELFDTATRSRVCVVIAAAGWGKSTAVVSWARSRRVAWLRSDHETDGARWLRRLYEVLLPHISIESPVPLESPIPLESPELELSGEKRVGMSVAAMCNWLRSSLREELVVVVEDLQELPPASDAVRLLEDLCRQAPGLLHIVLISRRELSFPLERMRGQGLITEINAADLAFEVAEVAALLRATVSEDPPGLAGLVGERTGGWPAALHCAVGILRGVPPDQRYGVVEHLTAPGERFHGYLAAEVLGSEPKRVRQVLRRLAVLGEVRSTTEVASRNDLAADVLADLIRRGLVRRRAGDPAHWLLVQPVADFFEHKAVLSVGERMRLHAATAQGCLRRGAHAEALRHLVAAGDHRSCAALLIEHGAALMDSGQAAAVVAAAELPPEYLEDPRIQRVLGQARHMRGQWAAAKECYQRA
ncbi:MAG: hypothetical protein ACRDQ5_28330, partial [Sciscionella sp.]